MAKVSRSVLKEVVKECLLEILFEGIDSESGYEEEEPIREARSRRRASSPSPKKKRKAKPQRKELNQDRVQEAVSGLTQDPIMASIYADTANTTLQEQREGRRVPADNAAAAVENTEDLGDIFAGAGNWAAIAFNETE